jgi:hypothetical protein
MVGFILSEIGRLAPKLLARDLNGSKNISAFIVEASDALPDLMAPHIGQLTVHLEGEVS